MKKVFLTLLLTFGAFMYSSQTMAQELTRQERKAKHLAEDQALDQQLQNAITSQDIEFIATEIAYGQSPYLQNIDLNTLYGVWASEDYLKIYLPLYGPNNFNGQPSLMHKLDFFVSKYTYKTEPLKDGASLITIVAQDPWSINTYTFRINANANGNYSNMSVDTPFVGPVSYNGTVDQYSAN